MNILETEWWSIGIPSEWWTEQEEELVVIGDSDDVGCIEISTLQKDDGDFAKAEVTAIAVENGEPSWKWLPQQLGEFGGCGTSYCEEGTAVREWCVAAGPVLLFITYSCDLENQGMDDAAVDEILQTLGADAAS